MKKFILFLMLLFGFALSFNSYANEKDLFDNDDPIVSVNDEDSEDSDDSDWETSLWDDDEENEDDEEDNSFWSDNDLLDINSWFNEDEETNEDEDEDENENEVDEETFTSKVLHYNIKDNKLSFEVDYLLDHSNFVVSFVTNWDVEFDSVKITDLDGSNLMIDDLYDQIVLLVKDKDSIKMYSLNEINSENEKIKIKRWDYVILKWELDDATKMSIDTITNWSELIKIEFEWKNIDKFIPDTLWTLSDPQTLTIKVLYHYAQEWSEVISKIKSEETWAAEVSLFILFVLLWLWIYYININTKEV